MYSELSQKSKMKSFFSFQKLAQISGYCVKFAKERIKTSVASEMFKTENHSKTPQVVDTTDGTRHIRKRGLMTLKRTLSEFLKILPKCLNAGQKWYPQNHPVRNTGLLKILKKLSFSRMFFLKWKISEHWFNHYSKIRANIFYLEKNEVKQTFLNKITVCQSCHFFSPIFGM